MFLIISILHNQPFIIFVTAYDSYALKAFEHHAIDYVLKPFTNDRLFKALKHASEVVGQKVLNENLERLLSDYKKDKLHNESDAIISNEDRSDEKLVGKVFGKNTFHPFYGYFMG